MNLLGDCTDVVIFKRTIFVVCQKVKHRNLVT